MKRVFLSFQMENKKQVDGVRLMAWNDKFDLEFYDESVRQPINSERAPYIKTKIKEKIARASVIVCFVGATTHQSSWVNWELETGFALSKRIILMGLPNGPERVKLPDAVSGHSWYLWDPDLLKREIEAS